MKKLCLAVACAAVALAQAGPAAVSATPPQVAPPTVSDVSGKNAPTLLDPNWLAFVHIRRLQSQMLPGHLTLFGKITFDEDQTQHVAAPMAGRIAAVMVDLGAQVAPGTPLLALAAPEAATLQALAQRADESLTIARRNWDRAKNLHADGAISDKEAAQLESDLKHAQLESQSLQAQRRALGLSAPNTAHAASGSRAQLVLAARQAGTVVQRNVRTGQQVHAESGDALLVISNLDHVWVLADLYEQDVRRVPHRGPVEVHVAAYPDEIFAGEINYVGDVLDAETRTLKVRCRVDNAGHRLKPEMFARVVPKTQEATVLVVPSTAVVRDGGQAFVLVVTDVGPKIGVVRRAVQLGPAQAGMHRVIGGLAENERMVTDGALFVYHALFIAPP